MVRTTPIRTHTSEQEVFCLIDRAVDGFHGRLDDLESAVGMLVIGRHYGWRVLLLMHSPATIRNYFRILGIRHLRTVLPEVGVLARRSSAWRMVDGTRDFWHAVRGEISGVRSFRVEREAG